MNSGSQMNKLISLLLLTLLLASCAIHRKFPYICYRKECVLSQLGFYAAKESFRRAKINASVRQHKRMVRKNIRNGRKGLKPPYDTEKENRQRDSLTYSGGFAGLCKETKVIFTRLNSSKDTVIINYLFEEKDPSADEKMAMKNCIDKTGVQEIEEILIKSCHNRSVMSEYEILWLDERARRISKYLKTLEIPKEKIKQE